MGESRKNISIRKSTYDGLMQLKRKEKIPMSELIDAWMFGTSFGLVGKVNGRKRR